MDLVPENRPAAESHLRSLGWLAPDEPLLSLTPVSERPARRTLRAATPAGTFILKQRPPQARVANPAAVEAGTADTLAVESAFYRALAESGALAVRIPELLGEDPANHLLYMTDLGPGPDFFHIYSAPTRAARTPGAAARRSDGHLTALVYWLWKLHALSPDVAASDPRLGGGATAAANHERIFKAPLQAGSGADLSGPVRQIQNEFAADRALVERAVELGDIYAGPRGRESAPVLLHGEYYPGNWLTHPTLGVMILNTGFACVGPPEFDVGVLLAHLTLAGLDQTELMMLMRSYVTPPGFSYPLAMGFAGMEMIHRLLGADPLPLNADDQTRIQWLQRARSMVLS